MEFSDVPLLLDSRAHGKDIHVTLDHFIRVIPACGELRGSTLLTTGRTAKTGIQISRT